jgi:hypothetical protein
MITTAQTLIDPSAAPLFGIAGLAARMASPLFARRDPILAAQLAASCLFATSYALMQQPTATSVCLIGAVQTTVALIAGERPCLAGAVLSFTIAAAAFRRELHRSATA